MNSHTSTSTGNVRALTRANVTFAIILLASVGLFWKSLAALLTYSLNNESSSHIILIPFVSAFLFYLERKRIFSSISPSIGIGAGLIFAGALLYWLALRGAFPLEGNEILSASTLSFLLILAGGFLASYGSSAARRALFPLLFLLLMVPLPDPALAWTVHLLQQGSTDLTCAIFKLLGVPFFRQGFILSLPSVTIEVAAECSGIRSSIALFVTCLLVAHLYLRTPWKIALFLFLVFPLTIVKNAIRIVTLTLLSIHVDPSFLHGRLHHDGGFVFFLIGLLLLLPVFLALEKSERTRPLQAIP
jgi:exosortase